MGPRLSLAQGHPGTGRSLGGHWAGTRGHCGPWEPWGPGDGDPASPIPIQGLIPPPPAPSPSLCPQGTHWCPPPQQDPHAAIPREGTGTWGRCQVPPSPQTVPPLGTAPPCEQGEPGPPVMGCPGHLGSRDKGEGGKLGPSKDGRWQGGLGGSRARWQGKLRQGLGGHPLGSGLGAAAHQGWGWGPGMGFGEQGLGSGNKDWGLGTGLGFGGPGTGDQGQETGNWGPGTPRAGAGPIPPWVAAPEQRGGNGTHAGRVGVPDAAEATQSHEATSCHTTPPAALQQPLMHRAHAVLSPQLLAPRGACPAPNFPAQAELIYGRFTLF